MEREFLKKAVAYFAK